MLRFLIPALILLLAPQDRFKKHKREDMPKGPPWQLSYKTARWEALRTGKPLFLFITKSY